ncbi:unnamed protein product [Phytomonas sp. EM1]|nr:unnamed protein product [Phytomonas sp. EM1]|eukprot:CCW60022.1 unnamed protein product [Phytomonas sp. isolate EM1]
MLLLQKNEILNEYRKPRHSKVQPEAYQPSKDKPEHNAAVLHRDPNALDQGSTLDENGGLDAFYTVGENSPYTGVITRVLAKEQHQNSAAPIVSNVKNSTRLLTQALLDETDIRKTPLEMHPAPSASRYAEEQLLPVFKENICDASSDAPGEGNMFVDQDNYSPISPSSGDGRSISHSMKGNSTSPVCECNGVGVAPGGVFKVLMSPSVVEVETPVHNDYVDLHRIQEDMDLASQLNSQGRTPLGAVNNTPLVESKGCNENNTMLTFNVSATSSFDEDISGSSFSKQQYRYGFIGASGSSARWHGNSVSNNDEKAHEGQLPLGFLLASKRLSATEGASMELLASSRADSSAISVSSYDMPPLRPSSSELMRYYELDRRNCGERGVMVASATAMTMVKNRQTLFRSGKSMELFPSPRLGTQVDIPVRIVHFHRESISSCNMDYDIDTIVVSPFNTSDISSRYIGNESQNRILDFQNERILHTLKNKQMIQAISFSEAAELLQAGINVSPEPLSQKKKKKKKTFSWCFCFDKNQSDTVLDRKIMQNNGVGLTSHPTLTTVSWREGLKVVARLKGIPYNHADPVHKRILFTIYYALIDPKSGRPRDQIVPIRKSCVEEQAAEDVQLTFPRNHPVSWEAVGFQGSNPATDLRDTGIVGLLQLLYMLAGYADLTQTLWRLCQSPYSASPSESLSSPVSTPQASAGLSMLSQDLPFVLVVLTFVGLSLDFLEKKKPSMSLASSSPMLGGGIDASSTVATSQQKSPERSTTFEEPSVFHVSPVLCAVCEYCIGCLQLFCESWQELIEKRFPNQPTVADFGLERSRLRDRLMKSRGMDLVKNAIKRAKQHA